VREAHVERGVARQHATQYQRGDGQRLLVGETQPQVGVEATEAVVATRPIDATRCGVNEQRHVQVDTGAVDDIERRVVEGPTHVGADIGADEATVGDRPS